MLKDYRPTDSEEERLGDADTDASLVCPYCGVIEDLCPDVMGIDPWREDTIFTNNCLVCGETYVCQTQVRYLFVSVKKDKQC